MGTTAIPARESEKVTWALNFEEDLQLVGADLGFSAAEITALVKDSQMMRYTILNAQTAAAFSKTCTAFKNEMLGGVGDNVDQPVIPEYNPVVPPTNVEAGILDRLSRALQRAKLSPKFNQAVAEQLMIGTETPVVTIPADAKPTASGTAINDSIVRLDWTKRQFDGVFIDSQRADETAWTRIGFDMRSPYEDARPPLAAGKPEERRYRLRYFIDDRQVGSWSDTVSTITIP